MATSGANAALQDRTNARQQLMRRRALLIKKLQDQAVTELDGQPRPTSPQGEEDLPPPQWVRDHGEPLNSEHYHRVRRLRWRGRSVIVKYGPFVEEREAAVMRLVRDRTSIPVPKASLGLLACRYGECCSPVSLQVYAVAADGADVFIYREDIDGRQLQFFDPELSCESSATIAADMKRIVSELHSIRCPNLAPVGDFGNERCEDFKRAILGCSWDSKTSVFTRLPTFTTTRDFLRWLSAELPPRFTRASHAQSLAHVESLDAGAPVVLTHGDLHSGNMLLCDGHVVGIVDWETAGWYPEWLDTEILAYYRDTDDPNALSFVAQALGCVTDNDRGTSRYLWLEAAKNPVPKESRWEQKWSEAGD
ncbi:hypothetical protein NBRC10512_007540 [Rhodotorula toruloides]